MNRAFLLAIPLALEGCTPSTATAFVNGVRLVNVGWHRERREPETFPSGPSEHPDWKAGPPEKDRSVRAPRLFDAVAALASLRAVTLSNCAPRGTRVRAHVTFDGSGAVCRVLIDGPPLDASAAVCATMEISEAHTRPFDGDAVTANVGWDVR